MRKKREVFSALNMSFAVKNKVNIGFKEQFTIFYIEGALDLKINIENFPEIYVKIFNLNDIPILLNALTFLCHCIQYMKFKGKKSGKQFFIIKWKEFNFTELVDKTLEYYSQYSTVAGIISIRRHLQKVNTIPGQKCIIFLLNKWVDTFWTIIFFFFAPNNKLISHIYLLLVANTLILRNRNKSLLLNLIWDASLLLNMTKNSRRIWNCFLTLFPLLVKFHFL